MPRIMPSAPNPSIRVPAPMTMPVVARVIWFICCIGFPNGSRLPRGRGALPRERAIDKESEEEVFISLVRQGHEPHDNNQPRERQGTDEQREEVF